MLLDIVPILIIIVDAYTAKLFSSIKFVIVRLLLVAVNTGGDVVLVVVALVAAWLLLKYPHKIRVYLTIPLSSSRL